VSAAPTTIPPAEPTPPTSAFTWKQRLALWLISWSCYLAIRVICPTLRFSLSVEDGAPAGPEPQPCIFSFWHRCVFPATYFWRDWNIRVMTSQSFDGEYIARIIQKFGFVPVRGSSNRGAVRALLGMRREIEQGATVAFTIDGPRGPRYVAKPGPVLLGSMTGAPLSVFYIAVDRAWVLNTWDAFMIPKPFSRALVRMGRRISVPSNATREQMDQLHAELQESLERVREFAEANVSQVGSEGFPLLQRKT
jgi:lysophospholipid acyltransferase (LPLAT)-like uncharacterized protein